MDWIYLVIAGLLEIGWAIGFKYTDGFSRLWPSVATIFTIISSFGFLSVALRDIPVGSVDGDWCSRNGYHRHGVPRRVTRGVAYSLHYAHRHGCYGSQVRLTPLIRSQSLTMNTGIRVQACQNFRFRLG